MKTDQPQGAKLSIKGVFKVLLQAARAVTWFVVFELIVYACFAAVSAVIPVAAEEVPSGEEKIIPVYLLKSGPHTDFLVQVKTPVHDWSIDFPYENNLNADTALPWLAIGWGDKGFYLNTPTWGDLTVKTAVSAATGLGTAGIHASYYYTLPTDRPMVELHLTEAQYKRLCDYVANTLMVDASGKRILLMPERQGVNFDHDRYYDAMGTYSMIHTCNT